MADGRLRIRRCDNCKIEYRIYFWGFSFLIALTVLSSTVLTASLTMQILGTHWWAILLSFVLHWFAYTFFHGYLNGVINSLKTFPDTCPECGEAMIVSGGFATHIGPSLHELISAVVYLSFIGSLILLR
jgi:hypothetical protein